jgi:hypothetical protein
MFLQRNTCPIHSCQLEEGSVPLRYGLIRLRPDYLQAQKTYFPYAKTFMLGGCMIGPQKTATVRFCHECRRAEQSWNDENPDFNDPAAVGLAVETARRDLPDSMGKRILRQSQLQCPEREGQWSWCVYRIALQECVYFESRLKVYTHVDSLYNQSTFSDVKALVEFLDRKFGQQKD